MPSREKNREQHLNKIGKRRQTKLFIKFNSKKKCFKMKEKIISETKKKDIPNKSARKKESIRNIRFRVEAGVLLFNYGTSVVLLDNLNAMLIATRNYHMFWETNVR